MRGHIRQECKHGVLVAQCRCLSSDKEVRIVACPNHCPAAQAEVVADAKK